MKEIIKKVLVEWQEKKLPKIISRDYIIPNMENLKEILAITGPRRAGKTYFLYQIITNLLKTKQKDDIMYIDFEDYRLINFNENHIEELFIGFYELYEKKPKYLFLDEIQNIPNWGKIVRTLLNQNYKIIISGSSSKLLLKEISTELRGRYINRLILPFSFKEILKYNNIETKNIEYSIKKGLIYKYFDLYFKFGGFPEVFSKQTNEEKIELLKNYYTTIYYKDMVERYNIKVKYLLENIMQYSINSPSDIFSISKFEKYLKEQKLNGSKRTIANYLVFLKESFFLILLSKFSYSSKTSLLNPKKIYLIDTGFLQLGNTFSQNKGKILENIVAIELFKKQKNTYYNRENYECDFIIKEGLKIVQAIQVCFDLNEKNKKREFLGLIKTLNNFKLKEGLILTYNQEREEIIANKKIIIKPVWKWLLENPK